MATIGIVCMGPIEFFTVNTKLTAMAVLASKDLTTAKKVTSSGARPDARDYYWFKSPMLNQARLAFAWKSETFRSLYIQALLILTKSSKSKNQVCMNRSLKIS